jgi:putative ABC transport system ATP-binding protein
MESFVNFQNVSRVFGSGEAKVNALSDVSFEIQEGEFCVVVGPSGAGKTTILNLLGGIDRISSGNIVIGGTDITKLNEKGLTDYRRFDIGFVFQFYNLIQNLTVLENVEIASGLVKEPLDPEETLRNVGLEGRINHFPAQCSGGEQQRVAIARALAKAPKLLLADEPTGALDYATGKQILELLIKTSKKNNFTVILITHNSAIAEMADRVISLKNGRIESNIDNKTPKSVAELSW